MYAGDFIFIFEIFKEWFHTTNEKTVFFVARFKLIYMYISRSVFIIPT